MIVLDRPLAFEPCACVLANRLVRRDRVVRSKAGASGEVAVDGELGSPGRPGDDDPVGVAPPGNGEVPARFSESDGMAELRE